MDLVAPLEKFWDQMAVHCLIQLLLIQKIAVNSTFAEMGSPHSWEVVHLEPSMLRIHSDVLTQLQFLDGI